MIAVARRAGPSDAEELVRLRAVMLGAMNGSPAVPGEWSDRATASLRTHLPAPDARMAAFVVDRPDDPARLASCAVGVIDLRLGNPADPHGEVGYVFNVVTDPAYRRRGYSTACMVALLEWFRAHGVHRVDLRASSDGQPLYERLGFTLQSGPTMRAFL